MPLAHKALAFADMQIPLLHPAEAALQHGQCMLEPKVEARMLQDLHVQADTTRCWKSAPAPATWPPCSRTAPSA